VVRIVASSFTDLAADYRTVQLKREKQLNKFTAAMMMRMRMMIVKMPMLTDAMKKALRKLHRLPDLSQMRKKKTRMALKKTRMALPKMLSCLASATAGVLLVLCSSLKLISNS